MKINVLLYSESEFYNQSKFSKSEHVDADLLLVSFFQQLQRKTQQSPHLGSRELL